MTGAVQAEHLGAWAINIPLVGKGFLMLNGYDQLVLNDGH